MRYSKTIASRSPFFPDDERRIQPVEIQRTLSAIIDSSHRTLIKVSARSKKHDPNLIWKPALKYNDMLASELWFEDGLKLTVDTNHENNITFKIEFYSVDSLQSILKANSDITELIANSKQETKKKKVHIASEYTDSLDSINLFYLKLKHEIEKEEPDLYKIKVLKEVTEHALDQILIHMERD